MNTLKKGISFITKAFMREYFELDLKEKRQEQLMLILSILWILTLAIGIYYQLRGLNHNNILIPLFAACFGGYYLVYGINAFTLGNLIPKWTPGWQYNSVHFVTRKFSSYSLNKVNKFVRSFFGICAFIIALVAFTVAFWSLF